MLPGSRQQERRRRLARRFDEPDLQHDLLRLRHLDRTAAEDAIRKPLKAYNDRLEQGEPPVSIEDGLMSAIIDQVRSGYVSLAPQSGSGQSQQPEVSMAVEIPSRRQPSSTAAAKTDCIVTSPPVRADSQGYCAPL